MAVLVTGGAGYIGSHAVLDLVGAGESVVVLDDLSTGFRWAVAPEAELVVGDVGDQKLLAELIRTRGIDAVMHFAGSVVVPESVAKPLRYYLNNTAKSRTLIEAAVQGGVRHFVFSSTAAVYGPDVEQPVVEGAETAPVTPYGRSKLMTETMLADTAAAHGLRYAALRYFNVAGSDPELRTGHSTKGATHLIKVVAEAALGKRSHIDVYGTDWDTPDGTGVRDFIHVSDLTRAHIAALAHLRNGGRSIVANCGYGRGYSVREVVGAIERLSGRTVQTRNAPRRPGDLGLVVSDPSLLRSTLDWAPRHDDLDFIVRTALAWEEQLGKRRL